MLSVCECGTNLNNDLWTTNIIIRTNGKVLQIENQAAIIWLLLLLLLLW